MSNYSIQNKYILYPTPIKHNLNPLNAIFPLLPYKARILKNNGKLVIQLQKFQKIKINLILESYIYTII